MTPGQQFKLSCKSCRQRKVRCDRVYPCGPCQKSRHECSFPQPMRRPGAKSRNAELTQRLARLESLMGSIGGNQPKVSVQDGPVTSPENNADSPGAITSGLSAVQIQDHLPLSKADGSRYQSSDFFANLSSEVDGLRQLLNETSEDEDDTGKSSSTSHPSGSSESQEPTNLLLFHGSTKSDLRWMHPSSAHMSDLATLYFSRVDPKFKILHRYTTLALISHVSRNPGSYTRGQECLLFSIYFAAIISVTDSDCLARFGENRMALAANYKMALETSLVNANILETTEMAALQALVIYLVCSRVDNSGSRSPWTLFATAVRIAQAMEIDRDGTFLGLSVFETEMRRRMWWQLIVLDVFFSEARGVPPIIREDVFDTLPPRNINDDQLNDLVSIIGEEQLGGTEMTFSRISQDASLAILRVFALNPRTRKLQEETMATFHAKEKVSTETAEIMYSKWLANIKDNSAWWDSIGVTKIIICRSFLSLHRSVASLRPQTLKATAREHILAAAVCAMELSEAQIDPINEHFRWYTRGYVPWQTLAITLSELCVQNTGWLVERAWALVHITYVSVSETVAESKNGPLFRPIRKLLQKAKQVRLAARLHPTPSLASSEAEWSGLYSTSWKFLANTPGFYDLHDATVEMIMGRPEQLQVMLASPCAFPSDDPATAHPDLSFSDAGMTDSIDENMEPVDWENWESILQMSLPFEHPLPDADKSYWPLT